MRGWQLQWCFVFSALPREGGIGRVVVDGGVGRPRGRSVSEERQEGRYDSAQGLMRVDAGARGKYAGNLATLLRTRALEEGEERLESRDRWRGGCRPRACEGSRGCSRAPGRQWRAWRSRRRMYAPVGEGPSNQRPSLVNPWWLHPPGTADQLLLLLLSLLYRDSSTCRVIGVGRINVVSGGFRDYLFVLIATLGNRCVGRGRLRGVALNLKRWCYEKEGYKTCESDYMVWNSEFLDSVMVGETIETVWWKRKSSIRNVK